MITRHSIVPGAFNLLQTIESGEGYGTRLAWSPDGRYLAWGSVDHGVRIWDAETAETRVLSKHKKVVSSVAWSPDGTRLASGSDDRSVVLWDISGEVRCRWSDHDENVTSVAWSDDGQWLASGSDDGLVQLYDAVREEHRGTLKGHNSEVLQLAWMPRSRVLASASFDGTVRLWETASGSSDTIQRHSQPVFCLAWDASGQRLASGSRDCTVSVWDAAQRREAHLIEGFKRTVYSVAFAANGNLLAAKSGDDLVRIWDAHTWDLIREFREPGNWPYSGLAFHPYQPWLAVLADHDRVIQIWSYSNEMIRAAADSHRSTFYRSAKVVLVGDTGVGKSGLARVLVGEKYAPTESTHGLDIHLLSRRVVTLPDGQTETREAFLWDLGGQPDYRPLHQLHLVGVAVAVVLLDARHEDNPAATARFWSETLRTAAERNGMPEPRLLLATGRIDRGSVGLSPALVELLQKELGFREHFPTSARESWQVNELRAAIEREIPWERSPARTSTDVFQALKALIWTARQEGWTAVVPVKMLAARLSRDRMIDGPEPERDTRFQEAVRYLADAGLIRILERGELILLRPEMMDAYGSAILALAREEKEGLGCLSLARIFDGPLPLSQDRRLDPFSEKQVLDDTVQAFLKLDVAYRLGEHDQRLVFPSQVSLEDPTPPAAAQAELAFDFTGSARALYTALLAHLHYSGEFTRVELHKNFAWYLAKAGGHAGLLFTDHQDGRGHLVLFYGDDATAETRTRLEGMTQAHLNAHAGARRWCVQRLFYCPKCKTPVTSEQVHGAMEHGRRELDCYVCATRFPVEDRGPATATLAITELIRDEMLRKREKELEEVRGHVLAMPEPGVMLSYSNADWDDVERLAWELVSRQVFPWVDKWMLLPGDNWSRRIAEAARTCRVLVFIVGPGDATNYQRLEFETAMDRISSGRTRIIPIILRNTAHTPEIPFLGTVQWIDFRQPYSHPILQLVRGIHEGLKGPETSRRSGRFPLGD